MTKTDFLLSLDELLELNPGTLQGPEALKEMEGWDSLSIVSFMGLAKAKANVIVSPKQIGSCRTVQDLCALVSAEG
jgi:acyl carrier protein